MGLTIAEQLRAEGAEQTLRSALEIVLTERFGALPGEVMSAMRAANIETMNAWLRRAANAATLDEVGILSSETAS
jgi:hypothetical protein